MESQLPSSSDAGPSSTSSSQGASADHRRDADGVSNGTASYAFLVHSQHTLPFKLPPSVDNKPLVRQKRRRTSPEDQTVLEAEYNRNPKPDKAARMDIVSRVALGEKEVQIWFQNRRQNTRRRSKPLSPNELSSGTGRLSSSSPSAPDRDERSPNESFGSEGSRVVSVGSLDGQHFDTEHGETLAPDARSLGSHDDLHSSMDHQSQRPISGGDSVVHPSVGLPMQDDVNSRVGFGVNTQQYSQTSVTNLEGDSIPSSQASTSVDKVPGLLRNASSSIRLSLSLGGKAHVVTGEDESPPRKPAVHFSNDGRRLGLQRSQSLSMPGEHVKAAGPENFGTQTRRSLSGRSKDSRAWEFYCDSDARNALSAKAEQESSGSAIGAIEMLRRSNSGSIRLASQKRQAPKGNPQGTKRLKSQDAQRQRGPLNRASSSLARLQSGNLDEKMLKSNNISQTKGKSLSRASKFSPSGDSDKENWVPINGQTGQRQRRLPPAQLANQTRKSALKENTNIPSQSTSLEAALSPNKSDGLMSEGKSLSKAAERNQAKLRTATGEVAIFEDETSFSPAEEDLSCVQGLLSLSQGDWK
ncbi:MAG: hypothetical protein M4579_002299 [Chaenotheca gracillima]|nr:MAG: hypothetical protein M4579_002299 [Chaenotheca gracillima]